MHRGQCESGSESRTSRGPGCRVRPLALPTQTPHLAAGRPMSGVIPILLYHSVSDQPTGQFGPYTVSRSQLASHLDQVTGLGFHTLTVGQLVAHRAAGLPLPPRTA